MRKELLSVGSDVLRFVLVTVALIASFAALGKGAATVAVESRVEQQQLPYFIPAPLKYSEDELAAIRKSAAERNIAILRDQAAQASDRSTYALERQRMATVEMERRRWQLQQEQRVYERQLHFSDVVFWVSNFIVLVGVVLTIQQFTRDQAGWRTLFKHNMDVLRHHLAQKAEGAAPALTSSPESETRITLRTDGVEIGTRVTGLAILLISLGFYYLMLTHVYHVSVAPADLVAPAPSASEAK